MKIRIIKKGFNYSQDGPGNRLVYHLAGCNMTCPWCANPEGMDVPSEHPGSAMKTGGGTQPVAWMEVEALVDEARSAAPILIDGGGVTFSGGEPTLQFEALARALRMLRSAGIHTAIETNASSPRLKELVPVLDLLIADFKHPFSAAHKRHTGMGNERILRNLSEISRMGIPMWIRTPLVHGVNDSEECLEGFIKAYTQSLKLENVRFELLPYHEYGVQKWAQCGKKYKVSDGHVSADTVKRFADGYRSAGLELIKT